jgi:pyrimidine operon attenuation protein / uracil phosphoribosyltransferase
LEDKLEEVILTETEIEKIINNFSKSIVESTDKLNNITLIGIRTRGVYLAQRIRDIIEDLSNRQIPVGILDINFYRDDLAIHSKQPVLRKTEIGFSITDKDIILIDDVLYTGRTIRAALEALMDFGRPRLIKLVVLIDRGLRELPIQPDIVGKIIQSSPEESVQVLLKEHDGEDKVIILKDS